MNSGEFVTTRIPTVSTSLLISETFWTTLLVKDLVEISPLQNFNLDESFQFKRFCPIQFIFVRNKYE